MPRSPEQYDNQHQDEQAHLEAREDVKYTLFSGGSLSKEKLDLYVYSDPRENDDTAQTQWRLIQEGLNREKLGDEELAVFAQAVGEYTKDAIKEIMDDRNFTSAYAARDDLLLEKRLDVEANLTTHAIMTIAERSTWDIGKNHMSFVEELLETANHGGWEELPDKIKQISQD